VRFFRDETGAYVSKREGWVASLNPAPPPFGSLAEVRFSSGIDDFEITQRGTALFLAAISACALVLENAVLVHGAAMLAPDGQRALAFVGPSGAGKTTMTRRLPGWQMLADESLCLDAGMEDGVVRVSGTPFTGKERNPRTEQPYPLAAIVLLHKGADDARLVDVETGQAMERLMARTYCCASDGVILERHLSVADRIAARVPMKALHSNLSHEVMSLLAPLAGRSVDLAEGAPC